MKLLTKKQTTETLNLQKKTQIDEGVKIAQKVDVLRETLASLEDQHKKFLAGTLEEQKRITNEFAKKRTNLSGEVRKLEERKQELLKPLDKEWEKLEKSKKAHEKDLEKFSTKSDELDEREKGVKKAEKSLKTQEGNLDERERLTRQLNVEAQETKTRADKLYADSQAESEKSRRNIDKETRELALREEENNGRARAMDRREEIFNKKEKELNDKERFINDKYETLMRTIERLEK